MLPPPGLSPSFRFAPPEVIFQIIDAAAAQPDGSLALSLALVAPWVRKRVELFIYRTVVLSSASKVRLFAQTVAARPASFFAKHVRRLWIASTDAADPGLTLKDNWNIQSILAVCTGVVDLTLDQSYLMDNPDPPSRPTSFTIVTSAFIFFLHFTSPIFERVTHLYLLNGQLHHAVVPSIVQLPALTHVAISWSDQANPDCLKSMATLLTSSTLRRLVVIPWTMSTFPFYTTHSFRLAEDLAKLDDPRMIVLPETIEPEEQFQGWNAHLMSSDLWWDRADQ
jgi:hypothetical protein